MKDMVVSLSAFTVWKPPLSVPMFGEPTPSAGHSGKMMPDSLDPLSPPPLQPPHLGGFQERAWGFREKLRNCGLQGQRGLFGSHVSSLPGASIKWSGWRKGKCGTRWHWPGTENFAAQAGQVSADSNPTGCSTGLQTSLWPWGHLISYRSPSQAFSDFPEVKQITTQRSQELVQGHPDALGSVLVHLGCCKTHTH